jgi:D-alanyl-lipoteichoic acid acyltransferase DltB (MBOAT superfamily)
VLFNSFAFLASFALFACAYYAVPRRLRWGLLLFASLAFYATFDVRYLPLLLAVTLVAYLGGRAIDRIDDPDRRRTRLALSVALVMSALVGFKYLDFLSTSLGTLLSTAPILPRLNVVAVAGLSFYTFSCVSYLVDVYRRQTPAASNVGHFMLYVAFFPKILAGPIERAGPFLEAIHRGPVFDDRLATSGLQLVLWGLFKKVVIADRLAVFVNAAYGQPDFAPPADLVIATYFFAFQLYCDFSGYSDIAIGVSRVLGIDLMVNFRRPYLATSVPEFWSRRWHLSLAAWFRDYLYIPLGGSRVSAVRAAINVMVVFLASGLWHGAAWTFVIWGGLNGLFTVLAPMTARLGRWWPAALQPPRAIRSMLASLITFHLILVTWVFFRAATIGEAVTVISRVGGSLGVWPALVLTRLSTPDLLLSVGLVALLLGVEVVDERRSMWERLERVPMPFRWATYYALLGALVVLGTWNLQQFVYMQF